MYLKLLVALLLLGVAASYSNKLAPRFAVNLDLPPKQRWENIIEIYQDDISYFLQEVKKIVPSVALDLLGPVGEKVNTAIPYPYNYELIGVAETLKGINIGEVILVNTLYEITSFSHGSKKSKACTSIVAERLNGTIYHGRNLDYSLGGILRNLTITVDFQRGGKTAYIGTTYAGYVGLLTGQKPHGYTISLDERDRGMAWMNALEALANGGNGIAAFHIRDALDNEDFDFEKALNFLAYKPLIAPCYIIIGGTKPGEGVVITRDRIAALDLWRIDANKGRWYLVETNYDHWEAPPDSDNRRDPAIKYMNELANSSTVGSQDIFQVLSRPPVLNDHTTYTVVMSAAEPELYNTWIREID